MNVNRETFFSKYRQRFGKLSQRQVDGLNFLLDKFERETFTPEEAAYVLATVKHESAHTFQPIKEKRGRAGTKIRGIQDRYWDSNYMGRGYVQITWKRNYEKFGIANDPEKALEPEKAYEILSRGMREGLFTGKKLSDYISAGDTDYVQARRIVNGLDRANDIAAIAEKFEDILKASLVTDSVTDSVTDHTPQPEAKVEPPSQPEEQKHQPPTQIQAVPPLPVKVPDWAKKIVGWGAGLNVGGLGVSFAFLRDNPEALSAMLNILKFGLIALGGVAILVVIGVFVKAMWNAKLANDLNVARLHNYANKNTENVDFSGWKAAPDSSEVKL